MYAHAGTMFDHIRRRGVPNVDAFLTPDAAGNLDEARKVLSDQLEGVDAVFAIDEIVRMSDEHAILDLPYTEFCRAPYQTTWWEVSSRQGYCRGAIVIEHDYFWNGSDMDKFVPIGDRSLSHARYTLDFFVFEKVSGEVQGPVASASLLTDADGTVLADTRRTADAYRLRIASLMAMAPQLSTADDTANLWAYILTDWDRYVSCAIEGKRSPSQMATLKDKLENQYGHGDAQAGWTRAELGATVGYNSVLKNILYSLSIANCKNSEWIRREPRPRRESLTRAEKKKFSQLPLRFAFHTLRITAGRKRIVYDGPGSSNSELLLAHHLVRGHFKTYKEDAPLFGKYIGRYWWPPHVRGSLEVGIIEKDYEIREQ